MAILRGLSTPSSFWVVVTLLVSACTSDDTVARVPPSSSGGANDGGREDGSAGAGGRSGGASNTGGAAETRNPNASGGGKAGGGSGSGGSNRDGSAGGSAGDAPRPDGGVPDAAPLTGNPNCGVVATTPYLEVYASIPAQSAVVADFDEDTHADLLFATTSGVVHIKFGDGKGDFASEKQPVIGVQVEAADLNGDHHQDIVLVTPEEKVAVALGDGKGGFTLMDAMPVGDGPSAIAVADLNHDDLPDLAVANTASSDVSILFAKAEGGFEPEVRVGAVSPPSSIAVSDLNTDGDVDLLLGGAEGLQPLYGDGTAAFTQPLVPLSKIPEMKGFLLTDLNGDGRTDLVLSLGPTDVDDPWVKGRIGVQLSYRGSFGAGITYHVAGSGTDVKVADVDGDGKLDIGALDADAGSLDVLLGYGNGGFAERRSFALTGIPASLAFADLNGDARADLAAVGSTVEVVLNAGTSLFGPRAYPTIDGAQGLYLADVTGDGVLDALVTSGFGGNLVLHEGSSSGVFGSAVRITNEPDNSRGYTPPLAIGDFDRNGSPDLALANDGVTVYQRSHGSAFELRGITPWPGYLTALVSGDLDEDGRPDLIATEGYTDSMLVRLGKPAAEFDSGTSYGTGDWPNDAFVADVDRDGHLDVVVDNYTASHEGSIAVYFGRGNGTLAPPLTSALQGSPLRITPGDLNHDGRLDIVARYRGKFDVLLGDGKGAFELFASHEDDSAMTTSLDDQANRFIAIDDFSGDGVPDVAVTLPGDLGAIGPAQAVLAIWRGKGDGDLMAPEYYPLSRGASALAAADLDGDGLVDLAVLCPYSNNFTVILNRARCR
jgi:hypothetical protein